MSSTHTVTFEQNSTNTKMAVTTATPEHPSKFGFLKRLGTNRKRTNDFGPTSGNPVESTVNGSSSNHQSHSPSHSPRTSPTTPQMPVIEVRRPSETPTLNSFSKLSITSQENTHDAGALSPFSPVNYRPGVRFAPEVLSDDERPSRSRTISSETSRIRRSSIYARGQDGVYDDGVDAGVGSKARRLSVQFPDSFEVDECKLDEHFGPVARMRKKQIGEGGAATVQIMESKTAGGEAAKGRIFAVKEFRAWEEEDEPKSDYERKIKSEYAIAKACKHPNIVETFQLCFSKDRASWHHVMEYCEVGDLNDAINKGYFTRDDKTCMMKQLLRGVEYLHSRGIAHRDLKSENLLLSGTGCLKIADFGTSEVFSGTHPGLRHCRRPSLIAGDADVRFCKPGLVGSRPYMAPELIRRQHPYDARAVDMWSCGVILLTLMVGGTPWEEASEEVNNFNIYCGSWDEWLAKRPDGILDPEKSLPRFANTKQFMELGGDGTVCLAFGLLHPDASKRWTAKDALEFKTTVEYPCCQQNGYSDDIKTRQRKVMHNHVPPKKAKGKVGK